MAAAAGVLAMPALLRAQTRVIRFSHVAPDDSIKGLGARLFKQRIEERSEGRIQVEIFPDAQLVGDGEEMEALALGDVQMIAPSLSKFSRYAKRLQVFDLPYLFDSLAALDRFEQSETGVALRESMVRLGFVGLAYWRNGFKQLSAGKPLRHPDDARGLKFRIQDSPVIARQFEILGAEPVAMEASRTRAALAAGLVDGTESTWSSLYLRRIHEVQAAVTASDHGIMDDMVVVSTEFWQALPEELRLLFNSTMEDVRVEVAGLADRMNQEARAAIRQGGQTGLVTLTPAERRAWSDRLRPVWTEFEEEIGRDLIQEALRANDGG
ncbi:DctP family TRAP transporter solute-binding subunit [Geminicoccus roseus]|uniref:DctP family TRAP transporter solute-binding subunit n=1 Tax=Geminicoccus roseus TaxID=404900 RepID=UPI001969F20B|nr:DctP family TRAP transporter solute-binding subunit [Geminicoccus roseus]